MDQDATLLMQAAAGGDSSAADRLLPLVYEQLRKDAQRQLAEERPGHSLQATAMVHDAYLRLVGPREIPWQNRAHFYAAAVEAMRRVLLDHARKRARRGVPTKIATDFPDADALADADPEQILAVDREVRRLEAEDPESAAVVRLRFYAGLSVDQAAEALGISPRTCARLWSFARATLYRRLSDQA